MPRSTVFEYAPLFNLEYSGAKDFMRDIRPSSRDLILEHLASRFKSGSVGNDDINNNDDTRSAPDDLQFTRLQGSDYLPSPSYVPLAIHL